MTFPFSDQWNRPRDHLNGRPLKPQIIKLMIIVHIIITYNLFNPNKQIATNRENEYNMVTMNCM